MKKITAIIFALALILALPACTKTTGNRANKALGNAQHPTENSVVIAENKPNADTTIPQVIETASATKKVTEPATTPKAEFISRERAIEIALEIAGLTKNSVYELEAELEKERQGTFWEVGFETKEYEYSYKINAETGVITKSEVEPEKETHKNTTKPTVEKATEPVTEKVTEPATTPKAELISRERAIEIALEKAGLTRNSVFELEAELEKERYGTFWEVDFETREFEYSYEINAETENVIHEEKERND